MKAAKSILFILIIALLASDHVNSQTSFNMYLLARVDPHPFVNGNSIGCWGYVQNGREYGIFACNQGTSFIDVTDTANIHEVYYLIGNYSNWRDFKIYQHWIYIVNDVDGGMQIADLQYLPDSVHLVNTYSFTGFIRAHTIQQSGPFLYVNGGSYSLGGVFVLDLNDDPVHPVKRGQWELQYVHDERVLNDTLWACNIYTGTISVIDATNKDSLRLVTSWVNGAGPMPHNCAITNDRKYLFATDEILNPVGRLKIWNIENIHNTTLVTTWYPAGGDSSNVHNVEIYGNLALICHYTAGIRVLDISNPQTPVEIAWYDTYPQNNGNTWNGCKGIYMLPSGKILANDKQTGFYCVKIGNPTGTHSEGSAVSSYSLEQNYPNPFNPETNIGFTLPKSAMVTLKVFDITGREVITLLNGTVKSGYNRITFDGSNLATGIYFYKLISNEFTETRKMMLIK
jgi:choice-of-anchor B domain-containing protein